MIYVIEVGDARCHEYQTLTYYSLWTTTQWTSYLVV